MAVLLRLTLTLILNLGVLCDGSVMVHNGSSIEANPNPNSEPCGDVTVHKGSTFERQFRGMERNDNIIHNSNTPAIAKIMPYYRIRNNSAIGDRVRVCNTLF